MEDTIKQRIMTQPEKVEYIVDGWSRYFGIDRDILSHRTGSRSELWKQKRYLVMALDKYTALNNQAIANTVGYKQRANVAYHLNVMKEELSNEMYGQKKIKDTYNEFISYLNL